MRTTTREVPRLERTDEGAWLHLLLADIQREIAEQPVPGAVARIRARLLSQLDRPARAAA